MSLKGNDPVLLDHHRTVWVVESGIVALFSVSISNGIPAGPRRLLCRLDAGEAALFNLSAVPLTFGVLAVAIEEARLQPLTAREVIDAAFDGDADAVRYVEGWIRKISRILSVFPPPDQPPATAATAATAASLVSLRQGAVFQLDAENIRFVKVQSGALRLFGLADQVIDDSHKPLPIAAGVWLEAESPTELSGIPMRALASAEDLESSLIAMETTFLQLFQTIQKDREQKEWERLQKKNTLSRELSTEAFGDLASVLQPAATARTSLEGGALFRAIAAIGEFQNIAVRPPSESNKRAEPLQAIAEASGLRTRRVILSGTWLKTENGPLLAFTSEGNQPVALLPIKPSLFRKSGYEIFNPADETRQTVGDDVAATLSPSAVTFYRPLPDKIKSLDILKFGLQGRSRDVLVIVFAGIAATLLGMLTPQATSVLVERGIPDANRTLVMQIGLGLFAAALGSLFFEFAQSISLLRVENGSSSLLQSGVWDRLLKLSPGFFRKYTTGDLASRADGINRIRQRLSGASLRSIFGGFTSTLNLILMFYYSPTLAVTTLGLGVAVVAFSVWSGLLVIQLARILMEKEGGLFGTLVQLIHGVPKLRIAGAELRAFSYWGRIYSQQQKIKLRMQQLEDRVRLFGTIMPSVSAAIIFGVVSESLLTEGAGFALGTFLAFNAAFGAFLSGITTLSDTSIGLLGVATLWKRAQVILEAEPEVDSSKSHPGKLSGRVSMDHIVFRYRNDGPMILDDVSIEAAPGECIALVGPSGSGKSTILNLLLRFEVPISGAIYYDGQDLNGLDVNGVRRQLGVVLQENKIMAGSVFENIICGSLSTLQDAWDAARAAAFAEDVEEMPLGMHTPVSEGGGNISGGQRQRLLISRALVSKPSILIFDEATSALDNRTQAIVTESLRNLKVTTIIVAHRLSTIRHADRIYVIEAGRVVQKGSFEKLAGEEGLFARLMARQVV